MAEFVNHTPETGDTILVVFKEPQEIGSTFVRKRSLWPLHITLVPWFAVDDLTPLIDDLSDIAHDTPPFTVQFGPDTMFNPETEVSIVAEQFAVKALHTRIIDVVQANGATFRNYYRWVRDLYNAHMTHHGDAYDPVEGKTLRIADFSLAQLHDDNVCEVIRHFELGA